MNPPDWIGGAGGAGGAQGEDQSDLLTREKRKVERPKPWKVLLHNDDFTTMQFVIDILVQHFEKSPAEAIHVMLQVHRKGIGVAGVYPRDMAETKVAEVTAEAQAHEMPLLVTAEPD